MVICLEGPHGTGKSTQAKLLVDWLKEKTGNPNSVYSFRDPGVDDNHTAAQELRRLGRYSEFENPATRLMLFLAAKLECASAIKKIQTDNPGAIIVLDRFAVGFYVYGWQALAKLNNWPAATLTSGQYNLAGQLYSMMTAVRLEPPDITMILMLDHKVAYSRALAAAGKDNVKDKYEANGFEEYQARAKDYNAVAYLATGSQYKMCGKTVIGVPYSPLESVEDVRTVILNRLLQEQSFVKLLPVSNG